MAEKLSDKYELDFFDFLIKRFINPEHGIKPKKSTRKNQEAEREAHKFRQDARSMMKDEQTLESIKDRQRKKRKKDWQQEHRKWNPKTKTFDQVVKSGGKATTNATHTVAKYQEERRNTMVNKTKKDARRMAAEEDALTHTLMGKDEIKRIETKQAAERMVAEEDDVTLDAIVKNVIKEAIEKESRENKKSGGKVKKYRGGGKVYSNQNKRYAHGGKVSGRKATYKY